jgi:excisionase family DNA binding protein
MIKTIHESGTNNDVITIREVAGYFKVSIRTVREWIERDSTFPRPFKKFGTLRFRRTEIEKYWMKNIKSLNSKTSY